MRQIFLNILTHSFVICSLVNSIEYIENREYVFLVETNLKQCNVFIEDYCDENYIEDITIIND